MAAFDDERASKRLKGDPGGEEETALEEAEDADVMAVLEELANTQEALEQVNDQASDEVLAVERRFNARRRPLYERRSALISRIPGFWRRVLTSHEVLAGIFSGGDEEVLDYCTELLVQDNEDIKSGYAITLRFRHDNPIFSNTELVKRISYADDGSLQISGADIAWRPGQEPPESEDPPYSFFQLWMAKGLEYSPGESDDIATILKEDVWPHPLQLYQGGVQSVSGEEAEEASLGGGAEEEEEGEEGEEDEEEEGGGGAGDVAYGDDADADYGGDGGDDVYGIADVGGAPEPEGPQGAAYSEGEGGEGARGGEAELEGGDHDGGDG